MTVVMDDCRGSGGQWTIDTAFNCGSGGGVRWRWQHLTVTVFDGIGDGLWQGDGEVNDGWHDKRMRGGAIRGNATTSRQDERTRERHNERTMRDDATFSWRDNTRRGWQNETKRR